VDTDVAPDTVYCYRVTFTHADACAAEVIYESPFSDSKLNLRGGRANQLGLLRYEATPNPADH
jgi:hypothetical protein